MSRACPFILIYLFLFIGCPVVATNAHAVSQTRAVSTAPQQDLDAISTMAEHGDAGAQNYLGFLHATGQNVPKDEKAAFVWFQKAAAQGHPEALGNLAMMYEKGLGVAKDSRMALSLHRQAAMAGYPISMKRLASLYEAGSAGEDRDTAKAEMWNTRYKESLKGASPAAGDVDPRQAAEKAPSAPLEKSVAPKVSAVEKHIAPKRAPAVNSPLQAPGASSGNVQPSPDPVATNRAAKPYFIQVGAKATAREAMEVIQKIVDKHLLPPNKNIELINPDGKNYRVSIGPFADANQAAPYQAKIMALLDTPPPEPLKAPPAANVAVPPPVALPPAIPPKAPAVKAMPASPAVPLLPAVAKREEKIVAPAPVSIAPPPAKAAAPAPPAATPPDAQAAKLTPAPPAAPLLPVAAKRDEKPVAFAPISAPPPPTKAAAPSLIAEPRDKEKVHYVELSGKATAQEATELIQKIVETGILPKNMRVEFVSPEADNYRIRIGPFSAVVPQTAQINVPAKTAPPPAAQKPVGQELVPVKPSASIAPALPAQEAAAKTAAAPVVPAPAEGKPSAAKVVRGRYYFALLNAKSTFEDSLLLAQTLLKKELVPSTHRVKIENLDGQNFRISVGPFSDTDAANRQAKVINQQMSLKPAIIAFEKTTAESGETDYQPIIQVNSRGDVDNAAALTKTLMEKGLLQQQMFVEIVNFSAGNYRVRYGPFKGAKEAGQDTLSLKKHLKVFPVMVKLERLAPLE